MVDRYASFDRLAFDRPAPHVLRVTINRPEKMNALDAEGHDQLERVWAAIDADPEARVSIITGAGKAFCAGGDFASMPIGGALDPNQEGARSFRSATNLVMGMVNASKPIVSAINGPAVGAGLAVALLADISIAAKQAKLIDGHVRIGVTAGDHAALIWPLLCGMAKAKYYLLTNETMTGEEAERNNLVSLAVDAADLQAKALEVAEKLASSAPTAVRMTKYVLNHWLRQQQAVFDLSAALEMINFQGAESRAAIKAVSEKSTPEFPDKTYF
ncbi:enoyl-CoA hydratase/isomerase family protein [Terricaulis silvestris]|uniref:Putative enoyl-CoA hydratase echA8 n=1 Tax=Terricaulis silvestris TaxID=2686094 RepID=A0A6I6MS51_9CAUL|nr:enoyl-CoA hydratase/isomerase family protein [Terricaulis silvestris]QGZ96208.1 putative enoyl-CoA hydratase echA8 [Terricaulis silvestris]